MAERKNMTRSGFCAFGPLDGHQWCRLETCTCTECDHEKLKEKK